MGLQGVFSSHQKRRNGDDKLHHNQQTFMQTMMEESIVAAEAIVSKWDAGVHDAAKVSTLFGGGEGGREEAQLFLRAVADLYNSMVFFAKSGGTMSSTLFVRANVLLQTAMRRLEHELRLLLSRHRDILDPEGSLSSHGRKSYASSSTSVDSAFDDDDEEEIVLAEGVSVANVEDASAAARSDLRAIAEAMMSAGYGQECLGVYKTMRKSVVDEAIYRLGFERLTPSQVQKLDWSVLEIKVRSWLAAAPVVFKSLFAGERLLCDHVFAGRDTARESCFTTIACEAAVQFLTFTESVAKSKRSPEKLFRMLDLYVALADLLPEIESMFSFDSTMDVRSRAVASLLKLAETVRATLNDFEAAIKKDASKTPMSGGGVHPICRYVMNYLVLLADYELPLANIFDDFPLDTGTPLPESFFDADVVSAPSTPSSSSFDSRIARSSNFDVATPPAISLRFAWLILVLLCKLDSKAELYKGEAALSYLFLANNLHYVVGKVKNSGLRFLLGDDWVTRHGTKARRFAEKYERLGWATVGAAVPAPEKIATVEEARERMSSFNESLEAACRAQAGWVVADARMREDVRAVVAGMVVPPYRAFYTRFRAALGDAGGPSVVKFSPEDVRDRIYGLLDGGSTGTGGSSKSSTRSYNFL